MPSIRTILQRLNKGNNPVFNKLYGTIPEVLSRQTESYIRLVEQFVSVFHHKTAALFSSPGRTEIGGNHTDHNHGRVLAGAVDLDNIAVAARNSVGRVRVCSAGYPAFEVDLSSPDPDPAEKHTSAALVRGVLSRMKGLGFQTGGFDVCVDGRVPKGSGLSSSASFEVLIGVIASHLFNQGRLDPLQNALIGQYAENVFFGKPCGLMDQTACAVGGFITIDFEDPLAPVVQKLDFDFKTTAFSLVITNTGGGHAHLSDEYAALPAEMKSVAAALGAGVLRGVSLDEVVENIPRIRERCGDRALLRAYHFLGENLRVKQQVETLERGDFEAFLELVIASGHSSFMYNQNISSPGNPGAQPVALGLALSEMVLKGKGAWRVHGGGFAGTIQAFVPVALLPDYTATLESVFGQGACRRLSIREQGAVKLEL